MKKENNKGQNDGYFSEILDKIVEGPRNGNSLVKFKKSVLSQYIKSQKYPLRLEIQKIGTKVYIKYRGRWNFKCYDYEGYVTAFLRDLSNIPHDKQGLWKNYLFNKEKERLSVL